MPSSDDVAELARAIAIIAEDDPDAARGLLGISAVPEVPATTAKPVAAQCLGQLLSEATCDDFDVELTWRVAVVGSTATGKSSLVRRFCGRSPNLKYQQTLVTDFVEKRLETAGEEVTFHVWDTPGIDDPRTLAEKHCIHAKACIIVYASNDRKSLEAAELWVVMLRELCGAQSLLVMARCKDDLEDVEVQVEEGEALAAKLGVLHFRVAASDSHAKEVFVFLAKELFLRHEQSEERLRCGEAVQGLQWADSVPSSTAW